MNTKKEKLDFVLGKKNLLNIIIGVFIIVVGFLLMIGGGTDDPSQFSEKLFTFRRITLSPILIIGGFGWIIFAIFKKFN